MKHDTATYDNIKTDFHKHFEQWKMAGKKGIKLQGGLLRRGFTLLLW